MAIILVGSTGGSGTTNGGALTRTIPVTVISGDLVLVAACQGSGVGAAFTVSSSSGGAYTQLTTLKSSNLQLGIHYQYSSGQALTQAVTSGTGNSSDTINAVVMVFRGVSTKAGALSAQSTTGSGTTPDSPSITPGAGSSAAGFALISAFAGGVQDATVTQPTSFSLTGNSNSTDNFPSTAGAAWLTYNSTAAINPTSWTNLTSANWIAMSILLNADAPDWLHLQEPARWHMASRKYDAVNYGEVAVKGV